MRLNEKCVAEYSTSSAPTDREGYLNKKGELNRGYQRRWFILKGNLLYYFEKRSDKEPIGVIVLDNCHVELAESGEPYAFQITFGGDGRTYILGADSSKEMEAWMRSITHSNYDCLRMMVESFESTLEKLTSDENDLASVSSISYPDDNLNRIDNLNNNATNIVKFGDEKDTQDAYGKERTYPERVEDFRVRSNESVENLFPPLSGAPSTGNEDSVVTFRDAEPAIGDLISFNVESDDEQVSIPSEFRLDDTFFSFSKHTTGIMPLNYSDMGQLEHMHAQNLLGKLGGNVPSRSKDDSELDWRGRRDPLPRTRRPKSERRKNNVHSGYTAERVDLGKPKTLSRLSPDEEIMRSHLERRSVFRHLHDLYSASICVKCKEFGGKVSTT
ncbi:uncharacterized protein [Acropora muricata]|uniref:uncharacterized protein n=1 Tax=Acropora muricata TaxID=159855 RepID=UPI0034E51608